MTDGSKPTLDQTQPQSKDRIYVTDLEQIEKGSREKIYDALTDLIGWSQSDGWSNRFITMYSIREVTNEEFLALEYFGFDELSELHRLM